MSGLLLHLGFLIFGAVQVLDLESVVRENDHASVVITGVRENNGNSVQGSGVCISKDGYILATAHQVNGVSKLQARFINGDTADLQIVELLPKLELSLLKTEDAVAGVARIGDATALRSGSPLVAIAAPQDLEFSTITGIVSSTMRTFEGIPVIQTNLQVDSGASGGPVFDQYGQLVGIIMLNLVDAQWISAINPINNAYPVLEKHGLYAPVKEADYSGDYELVPVPNLGEREYRAIEAYNKGVNAASLEEKRDAYTLATTLLPEFFEAWFNLAVTHTQAENLDAALGAYTTAAKLKDKSAAVYRNIGRLELQRKNLEAAKKAFTTALNLAPGEAQSYNDLGEVFRRMQEGEKALDAFETALSIRSDYPSARYNKAITLAGLGKNTEAAEAFEAYLKENPNAGDIDEVRGWINKLRGTG